jgi:peptide-methionine (R)-S-oxide reductase
MRVILSNSKTMKNEKKIYPIQVNEEELKAKLGSQSYHVLREKGTERAFTGEYYLNKETGIYECKVCGNEIFHSANKYDSGCGWPSFTEPVSSDAIDVHMDYSHLMVREEILCGKCGSHLGHRFPDGPKDQGGIRYCINSVSLDFKGE